MQVNRKKAIFAIGAFFVVFIGYRIVASYFINVPQKPLLRVKNSKESTVHTQQQVKSPPIQRKSTFTIEQKKRVNSIKNQSLIYHGLHDLKQVALTFDDGPDNYATPKILDILKKYQVSATFFVQGNQSKANPQVLRRIYEEGHTIGNHSYSHPQFTKLTNVGIEKQVIRAEMEIEKVIGKKPTLFRLPYGSANVRVTRQVKQKGYFLIQWNIDTNDWRGRSAKSICATVQKSIEPGSIILQHSNGKHIIGTVEALPIMIENLKSQRYEFVTIDQMLDVPAYK